MVHASQEDKPRAIGLIEAGADDYLPWPVDQDELALKLSSARRVIELKRRLAARQSEVERLKLALLEDTPRDLLTGLRSRHPEQEDLEVLAARADRYGHSFAVALFDIDHFESFNAAAGQRHGDHVLRSVAKTLVRESRRGDAVYRHSGQQMLVVLPYQEVDSAAIAAGRMREAIEALEIPHPADEVPGAVTASAGLARYEPGCGDEISKLLHRATVALEAAKESGRNRVVIRERAATS
jgi:diguanylate cyclase (GGDEF)-like protein